MIKMSLHEAQQLYFEHNLAKLRSILIMLGFTSLELNVTRENLVFVYKKGPYLVQIKPNLPVDIRTWNNNRHLQVYNEFKYAILNILDDNF